MDVDWTPPPQVGPGHQRRILKPKIRGGQKSGQTGGHGKKG
jgi:hypothetical protein